MELPEVSYMKAIDVWMGVCMTFVFGVMIEFTVCHFARNRVETVSLTHVLPTRIPLFSTESIRKSRARRRRESQHVVTASAQR